MRCPNWGRVETFGNWRNYLCHWACPRPWKKFSAFRALKQTLHQTWRVLLPFEITPVRVSVVTHTSSFLNTDPSRQYQPPNVSVTTILGILKRCIV